MKERDRYLKIVEWSDDDDCYVGSVPGWFGKCCHGDDEMTVYQKVCDIIDEWIDAWIKEEINMFINIFLPDHDFFNIVAT